MRFWLLLGPCLQTDPTTSEGRSRHPLTRRPTGSHGSTTTEARHRSPARPVLASDIVRHNVKSPHLRPYTASESGNAGLESPSEVISPKLTAPSAFRPKQFQTRMSHSQKPGCPQIPCYKWNFWVKYGHPTTKPTKSCQTPAGWEPLAARRSRHPRANPRPRHKAQGVLPPGRLGEIECFPKYRKGGIQRFCSQQKVGIQEPKVPPA